MVTDDESPPPKALDLFAGTGSASSVLISQGYQVTSLDSDPKYAPTICCNIMEWPYQKYPPGYFSIIMAAPPCTQFFKAKTIGERNLVTGNQLVLKTLEIVQYFHPAKWWLETPRFGLLPRKACVAGLPFWDVEYCQFGSPFKKPTRFYGSNHLSQLPPILCDGITCPNLGNGRRHLRPLGGPKGKATKTLTYYIPAEIVKIATGLIFPSQPKPPTKQQKRCISHSHHTYSPTPDPASVEGPSAGIWWLSGSVLCELELSFFPSSWWCKVPFRRFPVDLARLERDLFLVRHLCVGLDFWGCSRVKPHLNSRGG